MAELNINNDPNHEDFDPEELFPGKTFHPVSPGGLYGPGVDLFKIWGMYHSERTLRVMFLLPAKLNF